MGQHQPLSNKEKASIFLPLVVFLALAGGTWLGYLISQRNVANNSHIIISNQGGNFKGGTGKFDEVMKFVDARYLEEENLAKLEEEAVETILAELDPHSRYISLSEIARVQESLSGGFDGIGVEFFVLDDTIYIVNVIEGGPSEKAGVLDGDKIITINDSIVAGNGVYNNDVTNLLKGTAGSKVTIGIKRNGEVTLKQIPITRGTIPVRSVDVAYMLDDKTGLIKINRFSGTTYDEFLEAADELTDAGMENLVLDLRGNGGGYLDAAVKILDQLFSTKSLLVYTEGRRYDRQEYNSTGKSKYNLDLLMVLIDEGSASASEIVAGAVQDNDRGLIIGRRSFGKGLVQEQYQLRDGSALRLTVAKYFTPSGRYIQKPYDEGEAEYHMDLQDRYDSGELYYRDSIQIADSTEYRTTTGRVVYGGGGIIPDIFMPMDTLFRNMYYLRSSIHLPSFIHRYTDRKRYSLLTKYPTFETFNSRFEMSEETLEEFFAYVTQKNEEIERPSFISSRLQNRIKFLMKAALARQLYSDDAYYKILHQKDEMIEQALKEINK